MPGSFLRIPPAHGLSEVVVRGTVVKVVPGKPAPKLLSWLLDDKLPMIQVKIDDRPFQMLDLFLNRHAQNVSVAQTFNIIWAKPELPSMNDRIFITFSYARELESFFQGSPPVNLKNVEPIENEFELREKELADHESPLPRVAG